FAMFRYQFAINDVNGAFNGGSGIFNFKSPGTGFYDPTNPTGTGFAQIQTFTPPSSSVQNGATGIQAMQMGDNKTPMVMDWNVTVSQAMPWRSVLEVSYVANKSKNLLLNGNNDKIGDINGVPFGSYFKLDPAPPGGAGAPGPIYVSTGITCAGTAN